VHRSSAASGAACPASEQLGKQFANGQTFRQRMAVTPVSAEDDIIRTKLRTYACCNCLLTDVSVAGAMDESSGVTSRELLLGVADQLHRAIEIPNFRAH
jgi:hypothetical protein